MQALGAQRRLSAPGKKEDFQRGSNKPGTMAGVVAAGGPRGRVLWEEQVLPEEALTCEETWFIREKALS